MRNRDEKTRLAVSDDSSYSSLCLTSITGNIEWDPDQSYPLVIIDSDDEDDATASPAQKKQSDPNSPRTATTTNAAPAHCEDRPPPYTPPPALPPFVEIPPRTSRLVYAVTIGIRVGIFTDWYFVFTLALHEVRLTTHRNTVSAITQGYSCAAQVGGLTYDEALGILQTAHLAGMLRVL